MHLTAEPRAADRQASALLDEAGLRMLTDWLGVWPAAGVVRVVPSARRLVPGWDGRPQPLVGVTAGPELGFATVLSVSPLRFPAVGALVHELAARGRLADRAELRRRLPAELAVPHRPVSAAVLRWPASPAALPWVGPWRPADHRGLPGWLRPFGPQVLVALDRRGRYLAGAGIKRHSRHAHEIAVGTAEHARGRGLARSLVAQAATRVLADGAVPLYLHDAGNAASARVADAVGFDDRGWRHLALADA